MTKAAVDEEDRSLLRCLGSRPRDEQLDWSLRGPDEISGYVTGKRVEQGLRASPFEVPPPQEELKHDRYCEWKSLRALISRELWDCHIGRILHFSYMVFEGGLRGLAITQVCCYECLFPQLLGFLPAF